MSSTAQEIIWVLEREVDRLKQRVQELEEDLKFEEQEASHHQKITTPLIEENDQLRQRVHELEAVGNETVENYQAAILERNHYRSALERIELEALHGETAHQSKFGIIAMKALKCGTCGGSGRKDVRDGVGSMGYIPCPDCQPCQNPACHGPLGPCSICREKMKPKCGTCGGNGWKLKECRVFGDFEGTIPCPDCEPTHNMVCSDCKAELRPLNGIGDKWECDCQEVSDE